MPGSRATVRAALWTVLALTPRRLRRQRSVRRHRRRDVRDIARQHRPGHGTAEQHNRPRGEQMKIQITIDDQRFQATIFDSAAGRDLIAQLPLTIDMVDHGSVEKTGPLPSPLSLDGQPAGADPDVGDVGYYAPGNDFVLYYGDQSYYPGIVIIGRLDGDAASRIADMAGAVTATVEPRAD
jgi:hypothetical protein